MRVVSQEALAFMTIERSVATKMDQFIYACMCHWKAPLQEEEKGDLR